MVNKPLAAALQAGLYGDTTVYGLTAVTNGEWETTVGKADCFEPEIGFPQSYRQAKTKPLPQGKLYQRKLGWRILPIVSNSEKNLRH
jgi:hypothetical protein